MSFTKLIPEASRMSDEIENSLKSAYYGCGLISWEELIVSDDSLKLRLRSTISLPSILAKAESSITRSLELTLPLDLEL